MKRKIKIIDTTLRDGEQTEGVSFTPEEKVIITKHLIERVGIDRIEVASARVSDDDHKALRDIISWAEREGHTEKVEVLGFIDQHRSVDWIDSAGGKVVNILAKGSLKHLKVQLRKSPDEHISDIIDMVEYSSSKGISANIYLEDWSNGIRSSRNYLYLLLDGIKSIGIGRVMLADTLGILDPFTTYEYVSDMRGRFPYISFDFHGHNDLGMAAANSLAAVKAGAEGVHCTVNGLGERTGNTDLSSIVLALNINGRFDIRPDEKELCGISSLVELFSGIEVPHNAPIVGKDAFTQNCGVHADGDRKGGIYRSELSAERVGRGVSYSLGKTAGIASIDQHLEEMGVSLDAEQKRRLLDRIKELANRKETITGEDIPYILADMLGSISKEKVKVLDYKFDLSCGERPSARVKISIDSKEKEGIAIGDGQYDAFIGALRDIYAKERAGFPRLVDYSVRIPPGGKSSALVETYILWEDDHGNRYRTRGIDSDQLLAAIDATIKMLNINGISDRSD